MINREFREIFGIFGLRFYLFNLVFFVSLPLAAAQVVSGLGRADSFLVNQIISDGKNGRTWGQWKQVVREQEVRMVTAVVQRQSGNDDTFVNLRFEGEPTFEGGKRIYLRNDREQSVQWDVSGKVPDGKPLVLNAYNGEVLLKSVHVYFSGGGATARPPFQSGHGPRVTKKRLDVGEYSQDSTACNDPHLRIRRPRIEISRIKKTGDVFSGKYKIEGTIRGACIEEAGYYERGRLEEEIDFPLTAGFETVEFKVKARSGRRGEIRVYTTDGEEDIVEVDDEIENYY